MTEDTFISHLIELRDRLLRALIVFAVVLVALIPFSAELYDLLATPMMSALPEGSKMIATGVITPFLVPIKVAMDAPCTVILVKQALPFERLQEQAAKLKPIWDRDRDAPF